MCHAEKNTCQVHWKQCKTYVLQTPGHNLEIVSLYLHNIFYRPDSEFCGHNSSNYVWYRLCNCLEIHKFKSDCLYNYYFFIDIRGFISQLWTRLVTDRCGIVRKIIFLKSRIEQKMGFIQTFKWSSPKYYTVREKIFF